MDLSVLIVNYNVKAYIDQCLRSVERASQGLQVEVIVVDNASSDGSVAHIQKHFPWVTCIASPENLGFGRANNLAAAQAKGEFVLYLNPDTVVPEDNFRRALDVMRSKPEIGSMGCRMIDGSGHFLPESKRGLPTPAVALYRILRSGQTLPQAPSLWRLLRRPPRPRRFRLRRRALRCMDADARFRPSPNWRL